MIGLRFKFLIWTSWCPAFVDAAMPQKLQCIATEHVQVWSRCWCLWHSMSSSMWIRSLRSFFLRLLPPKQPIQTVNEIPVQWTVWSKTLSIFTAKFNFLRPSSLLFRVSSVTFLKETARLFLQTWLAQRINMLMKTEILCELFEEQRHTLKTFNSKTRVACAFFLLNETTPVHRNLRFACALTFVVARSTFREWNNFSGLKEARPAKLL